MENRGRSGNWVVNWAIENKKARYISSINIYSKTTSSKLNNSADGYDETRRQNGEAGCVLVHEYADTLSGTLKLTLCNISGMPGIPPLEACAACRNERHSCQSKTPSQEESTPQAPFLPSTKWLGLDFWQRSNYRNLRPAIVVAKVWTSVHVCHLITLTIDFDVSTTDACERTGCFACVSSLVHFCSLDLSSISQHRFFFCHHFIIAHHSCFAPPSFPFPNLGRGSPST